MNCLACHDTGYCGVLSEEICPLYGGQSERVRATKAE